jgi:hypothetical protein
VPQTSIFDKVRAKLKKQPLPKNMEESIKWYKNQIRILSGYSGDSHYSRGSGLRTELLADGKRAKEYFYQGSMYLFVYDPKLKRTLPYYDKFPLVFPIQFYHDGFLGINLHYLGYSSRMMLFHNLLTLIDKPQMDHRAKIMVAYRALKSMTRFAAFKPCLKRYLSKHILTHAVKIDAPDWETALFLPVENFSKRPKTFVWSDSEAIISGAQRGPSTNGLPKGTPTTSTKVKVTNQNGLPTKS